MQISSELAKPVAVLVGHDGN